MKIQRVSFVLVAVTACSLCVTLADAKKPDKPGGGGGGGDQGPSYAIVRLDDQWNGNTFVGGEARDINEASEVVGQVEDPVTGDLVAAYWSADNQLQPLLGSAISATGINDLSEIVGAGFDTNASVIGRYWPSYTDPDPLALLPLVGDDESAAYQINNDGVVCGYSRRHVFGPDPRVPENPPTIVLKTESRAVVWRIVNATVVGPYALPSILDIDPDADPNNAYGNALAISEGSSDSVATVVGGFMSSYDITAEDPGALSLNWTHAVVWSVSFDADDNVVAVPTILDAGASAQGVSNNDLVCGDIWTLGEATEAVVWGDTSSQTLDRSNNVLAAWAIDVNDNGVIVGFGDYSKRREQGQRAIVWPSTTGEMILLDSFLGRRSPLGHLRVAEAVNNSGEIVGKASNGAFLAIPN